MGLGNILVTCATPPDVPAVAALHHAHLTYHTAFDERYRPLPARNYESTYEDLLRDPLAGVLVARSNDRVVGFVSLRLHEDVRADERPAWLPSLRRRPRHTGSGTLVDLFVADECRRQGVGSTLVEAAMRWFTERGVTDINLGVMADNQAGLAFWRRMGFTDYRLQMRRLLD